MDEAATTQLPPEMADRFQAIRQLVRGARGSIWLVRDQAQNRAAVLHLYEQPLADPSHRQHLEAHTQAARALSHPNLLPTLGLGFTSSHQPYVLEEHAGGEDLTARLQRLPPPLELERLTWSSQVARALSAIHEAGLVHGHVGPSCVRIREDGTALLGGLGMGFLGAVQPEYAHWAPERWRRQRPTDRSDQWSWASVVLTLCRSRRAYPSADPRAIQALPLETFRVEGLEDPEALGPGLDQVLARALAPDPTTRLPGLDTLANQLDQERSRSQDAPPPPPEVPTKRTSVRGRTTSRIVLPKAVRAQKRNRKLMVGIIAFALASCATLLWVLLNPASP